MCYNNVCYPTKNQISVRPVQNNETAENIITKKVKPLSETVSGWRVVWWENILMGFPISVIVLEM